MEQNSSIVDFIVSIFNLFIDIVKFMSGSLLNGFEFLVTTFTNIPKVLFELFYELPSFYQMGLSGVFCCLLLVVFLKLIALVR